MNQELRRAGMESVHASWPPLALRRTVDQGAPKSARSVPRFGSAVSQLARRGHLQATGRAQKRAFRQAAHHRMQTAGGRQTGCRRQVGGKPDADGRWAADRLPARNRAPGPASHRDRPAGRRPPGGGRRQAQRAGEGSSEPPVKSVHASRPGPPAPRSWDPNPPGPAHSVPRLTPPPRPHARRGHHATRSTNSRTEECQGWLSRVIGLPTARRHPGRATGPRRLRFPPTSARARVAAGFHRSSGLVAR